LVNPWESMSPPSLFKLSPVYSGLFFAVYLCILTQSIFSNCL